MKLRKILKSMFENYCKTLKKPAAAGFFISRDLGYYYAPEKRSEKCLNILPSTTSWSLTWLPAS